MLACKHFQQITCASLSGSKLFDTLIVFLKFFFEKVNFEKKSADNNKSMLRVNDKRCLTRFFLSTRACPPAVFGLWRVGHMKINWVKWWVKMNCVIKGLLYKRTIGK